MEPNGAVDKYLLMGAAPFGPGQAQPNVTVMRINPATLQAHILAKNL
jgi:hypothetical protein